MATVAQVAQPQKQEHPRWEAFKKSWKYSNYITDFWNWLLTLLSKSAELVLFGSILYSSYQLIPSVAHVSGGIDALIFVIQQAALDIGGLGLMKLAKRAGLARESFPMRVGMTLVGLMIFNVVLFSLKQSLPMIPALAFQIVETILLIARAVMAVLFGHAIHALREDFEDVPFTAKDVENIQTQLREVTETLRSVAANTNHRIHQLELFTEERIARIETVTVHRIAEVTEGMRASTEYQQQQWQNLVEALQMHTDTLSVMPEIATQLEQLEQVTQRQLQVVTEEVTRVKVTLETQTPNTPDRIVESRHRIASPNSRKSSVKPLSNSSTEDFDKRDFVRQCLRANSEISIGSIQRMALEKGQKIAGSYVSEVRKMFLEEIGQVAKAQESEIEVS